MGWQPDEDNVGRALMKREELVNLATAFTMGCLREHVTNPAEKGFELAMLILESVNKVAPFPE